MLQKECERQKNDESDLKINLNCTKYRKTILATSKCVESMNKKKNKKKGHNCKKYVKDRKTMTRSLKKLFKVHKRQKYDLFIRKEAVSQIVQKTVEIIQKTEKGSK